jgi:MFS transporter, DHA1 family, tetracycline resistance protein
MAGLDSSGTPPNPYQPPASSAGSGSQPKREGAAGTPFVLITVLLDSLGVGLIIPVGPTLVGSFLGSDLTQTSHAFGWLLALYSLMQFLFAPVLGGLSDRFGRRTVILPSLFGAGMSYLISARAPALSWLFVGRVISGITGASFSAATSYIADVTPPEKRAQSFGLVGAAFGLGFIVGPAIGGALGGVDIRLPYYVAAGLNLVNLLYGFFVLPESLRPENRRPFSFARANPFGALRNLTRHPIVLGLTGTMFCSYMAQWILQGVWALYTETRFHWSMADVGVSFMVVGVAMAVVQGALIRMVIPWLGERRALLSALTMSALGFVGFGLCDRGWLMYLITFPFALGGIAGPATQALISREVGPSEQGELQGSLTSLASLTAIVGPVLGSALLGRFGPEDARPHVPGAPFFAAALLIVCGFLLALRLFARTPPPALPGGAG